MYLIFGRVPKLRKGSAIRSNNFASGDALGGWMSVIETQQN